MTTRAATTTLLGLALVTAIAVLAAARSPRVAVVPPLAPDVALDADEIATPPAFVTHEDVAMATTFRLVLPDTPAAATDAADVFALLRELDAELSEWKQTSPLSEVNRQAGVRPVEVPPHLLEVVERGIEIGELTDGAFDITWAALWGLWDFKAAEPVVPDPAEVARRVGLVDYRLVEIDREAGTVYLPRTGMMIGLGGIAKGYALERAVELLAERGYSDFMIVGGGQVWAAGHRGERPWRVGIRDPRGGPADYFTTRELSDASMSTSGDYESYFVVDGVRYHHVLDPRTGWPARGLESATVISSDAVLADALSTALLVMGPERAKAVVRRSPAVDAVMVDSRRVSSRL